ncbi:protein of uncharacterised function (DUF1707) [Mycobacteroides abscessus subsp. massiliense]|nr:protein of uncharacterised function (DUF1707) [Mycobacteroides abscessus subsp. massiliense]SKU18857.1 protein of uncharacterised function (DUF1707) [Mycobacteroides abscessus subsp. massiliense]
MSTDATLVLDGVFSSTQRRGAWEAPRRITMRRRMGSVKLDFTEASWPSEGVDIEVDLFGGSLEIRVPANARVEESLTTRAASFQDHRHPVSFEGPRLTLRGRATWCSVQIRGPQQEWRPVIDNVITKLRRRR